MEYIKVTKHVLIVQGPHCVLYYVLYCVLHTLEIPEGHKSAQTCGHGSSFYKEKQRKMEETSV